MSFSPEVAGTHFDLEEEEFGSDDQEEDEDGNQSSGLTWHTPLAPQFQHLSLQDLIELKTPTRDELQDYLCDHNKHNPNTHNNLTLTLRQPQEAQRIHSLLKSRLPPNDVGPPATPLTALLGNQPSLKAVRLLCQLCPAALADGPPGVMFDGERPAEEHPDFMLEMAEGGTDEAAADSVRVESYLLKARPLAVLHESKVNLRLSLLSSRGLSPLPPTSLMPIEPAAFAAALLRDLWSRQCYGIVDLVVEYFGGEGREGDAAAKNIGR